MIRIGLLLAIAACVTLAIMNPGAEAHKEAVYDRLAQQAGVKGLLREMAGDLLGNVDVVPLKYHNYFLYSTMTFRDETVSIGYLNNVRATEWDRSADELPLLIRQ